MMKESAPFDFHFDDLPEGICVIRDIGKEDILFANRSLIRMYKCHSFEEFLSFTGGSFRGMVELSDYRPLSEVDSSSARKVGEGQYYVSFNCRTRDGHFRRLQGALAQSVLPKAGAVWILSLVPKKVISSLTLRDPLTGLLSHPVFLKKALEAARADKDRGEFGVHCPMYFNLTNFKFYNASRGREAGNYLLQKIAEALSRYFPGDLASHQNSDNFFLLGSKNRLPEGLSAMISEVNRYIDDPSVQLKAGICDFDYKMPPVFVLRNAFDMAKIACDSIKGDGSKSFVAYEASMGTELENRAYVLRQFDRALVGKHIKVYFQPVIRTLTGKLCGMEALSRWEDPEKGLLTPSLFIPVLEDARIIYKLDRYMLEQVAAFLAFRRDNDLPVVPVSINLSRVDFETGNPLVDVEEVVKRYQLPRRLLRIEITESALIKSEDTLRKAITDFRRAGYECWLDDFGSRYSSLNVLHNFFLDELKIDMSFLRHFNERSREIIKSIVVMAKTLGIHTLAEGAETEEQVDFFRNMGCEKIQGYFYNRPLPWQDIEQWMKEKKIEMESPAEEAVLNRVGLVNVVTHEPVALYLGRGPHIRLLFQNEAHERNLEGATAGTAEEVNRALANPDFPLREKFLAFVKRLLDRRDRQTMTFMDNGLYFQLSGEILAGDEGLYAGESSVYNLLPDEKMKTAESFDSLVRRTLALSEEVSLYHVKEGTLEILETACVTARPGDRVPAEDVLYRYAEKKIYREDRERFLHFVKPDVLYSLANEKNRYTPCEMFRVRESDGSYAWKELEAYVLYRTEEKNILLVVKNASIERTWDRKTILDTFVHSFDVSEGSYADEWRRKAAVFSAFQEYSHVKWFVKDKNRRFVAVSRDFLSYYGLTLDRVLGKTDEEMEWHVDNEPFKQIEKEVLALGVPVRHAIGSCLVRGRLKSIAATKFPVYDGGKIVGLAGYFRDMSEEKVLGEEERQLSLVDSETGLASYRGMIAAGLKYEDNYQHRREEYMAVQVNVPAMDEVEHAYGREVHKALLEKVVEILSTVSRLDMSLSRISTSSFIFLFKKAGHEDMEERLLHAANRIHEITEINGAPVTLYLQYAMVSRKEASSIDGMLRLLTDRLAVGEKHHYGESLQSGDRIVFEREKFDKADESVFITDPHTWEVLYANRAMLKNTGYPEDYRWQGKKCYELWGDGKAPCSFCPVPNLRRDRFETWIFQNPSTGVDFLMRETLVSWKGKIVRFNLSVGLETYLAHYLHENEQIYREVQANDIISAGLSEKDPEKGLMKMMERMAHFLKAECILLLEEDKEKLRCTYEWNSPSIPSRKDALQHISKEKVRPFYDYLLKKEIVIENDVPRLFTNLGMKKIYVQSLQRMATGLLTLQGQRLGFIEIVNPAPESCEGSGLLLRTLATIFAILLRNRDMLKEMYRLGHTDELTGAGNLRAFEDYAASIPEGTKTAFFYCDIDNLKKINDRKGHHSGNEAIRHTAGALAEQAGLTHTYRLGGDEFLAVAADMDEQGAAAMAEAIREGFKRRNVSVSLGHAVFTAPFPPMKKMLGVFDGKMYENKREREK